MESCFWSGRVERLQRDTPSITVTPGPYRREFVAGCNLILKWLRSIGSGNPPGYRSMLSRKGILKSVEQELFKRRDIGFVLHLRPIDEPGLLESLDRAMDFGWAEREVVGDDRDRWPL